MINSQRRQRWLRSNAHLYVRHDGHRFMTCGSLRTVPNRGYEQKFDPDQPRVPAGSPDGGQWTSPDSEGESAGLDALTDISADALMRQNVMLNMTEIQ